LNAELQQTTSSLHELQQLYEASTDHDLKRKHDAAHLNMSLHVAEQQLQELKQGKHGLGIHGARHSY
jgi:hypothetical protein